MAKQHVSRVQNDFIEQQSQGEMLNNVGSGNTSTTSTTNGSISNSGMNTTPQTQKYKK
jgi:hypothetical protein